MDVGCGSGAFTIGAAILGYKSHGVSWDKRNKEVAEIRAKLCGEDNQYTFEVFDVRELDKRSNWKNFFDTCINCENIEHIINDRKLIQDIADLLKPGGKLLLTTPYYYLRPITESDFGPFYNIENGDHVRRGYTKQMLIELCKEANLEIEEISFCSGFFSQKLAQMQKIISAISPNLGWILILPLRPIVVLLDKILPLRYANYSICLEAYKPRFKK